MLFFLSILFVLFVLMIFFETRELYYYKNHQRPETDEEGCLFKKVKSENSGITIGKCTNKFYNKKFKENGDSCPKRCSGQTYLDCVFNFETMTRTDKYFVTKRVLGMLGSILGIVLTILNIIDKIS